MSNVCVNVGCGRIAYKQVVTRGRYGETRKQWKCKECYEAVRRSALRTK